MKVYTGGGDKGKTSLFSGERVAKHSLRLEAYGDLDELNSVIGALGGQLPAGCDNLAAQLTDIQKKLFQAGAWLATMPESDSIRFLVAFSSQPAADLEREIDAISAEITAVNAFILPAGHPAAGFAHIARTVCRRCERKVSRLVDEEMTENVGESIRCILVYLNRLSDYFFVAARLINHLSGVEETVWENT